MTEDLIIGIDLGTTHSLVGVVDSGFPIILADENGDRLLPSAISYGEGQHPLIGKNALRNLTLSPDKTLLSIKRLIGRNYSQLTREEIDESDIPLERGENDSILLRVDKDTAVTPIAVSAMILAKLKETAEKALDCTVNRAVITVPAYFNNSQREATKEAATVAGFEVERIINEPTAAALAYGLDKLDESQTVAVYDLGGGTFDLSILQMQGGLFEVLSTAGDTRLGGDDFDRAIVSHLSEKWNLGDLSPSESITLKAAARDAKEQLSDKENVDIRLPFFRGTQSLETALSRTDLEKIISPVLERTHSICRRAFAEASHKGVDSIDHLILVGGSTRTPLVREKLQEWFKLEPNLTQHPDEAIALGAAIQAGILCGRVRNVVLVDVTPLSLGIETFGGLMNVIIPRNSTIPTKAGEMFTNAVANQESMAIRVLQGEREMARDNWLLGEVLVPFQKGPKGSARVGVQFAIDQDGILEVLARDTETGEDHILEIRNSAVDVEDEEVERMVNESIDHAFDDMNQRVWTEAKIKSEELLPAVEVALEQVGEKLSPEEKNEIEAAVEIVKQILASDSQDASLLKKANSDLDDATQTLAALLVEEAFGG
ncbi:MAG: molecular chaperone DnaK [Verrucomicrobiales bacterium]|nr:molecular chaperone DnaK [Verrucomicrobiales bacterium]